MTKQRSSSPGVMRRQCVLCVLELGILVLDQYRRYRDISSQSGNARYRIVGVSIDAVLLMLTYGASFTLLYRRSNENKIGAQYRLCVTLRIDITLSLIVVSDWVGPIRDNVRGHVKQRHITGHITPHAYGWTRNATSAIRCRTLCIEHSDVIQKSLATTIIFFCYVLAPFALHSTCRFPRHRNAGSLDSSR